MDEGLRRMRVEQLGTVLVLASTRSPLPNGSLFSSTMQRTSSSGTSAMRWINLIVEGDQIPRPVAGVPWTSQMGWVKLIVGADQARSLYGSSSRMGLAECRAKPFAADVGVNLGRRERGMPQ